MAETDVLNPVQGLSPDLGDNPTWNYFYTRKKAINKQDLAARLGAPYSRDVGNAGHTFEWNWTNRPLATMQRLAKFYDDFKHGYFTVIDYDGGGREYVGRFLTPPYPQQTGHLTYTAQGVQFQERPQARMRTYPNNWTVDGHPLNVLDDDLQVRVALMQGAWATRISPALATGASASDPRVYEAFNAVGAINDWAQTQYVGWGFRMILRLDPTLGVVNILLDGQAVVNGLDLSTGLATQAIGTTQVARANTLGAAETQYGIQPFNPGGAALFVTVQAIDVPLDIHRVKIVSTGAASSGGGHGTIFPAMEYIY